MMHSLGPLTITDGPFRLFAPFHFGPHAMSVDGRFVVQGWGFQVLWWRVAAEFTR
jgi:hypothetical protein